MDELFKQRDYEGILPRISSRPEFGKCAPLTEPNKFGLYGSDTHTRKMIEDKAQQILDLRKSWMGTYIIVYKDNLPCEINFAGYSGD
jgi:hypothetical protein